MDREAFAHAVRQPSVDVPHAALLLAREIAYPGLPLEPYLEQLDALATSARSLTLISDELEQGAALATHLAGEAGFQGNVVAYSDPRNSFLNDVLERRQGIPITLSIVFIAVARRLGLDAYGIGLPGHFIAGVRAGSRRVLLDPFHGGARLNLADCQRLVRETAGYQGPFERAWLEPVAPPAILARLLNNLRLIYFRLADWPKALAVLERLQQVQPDEPAHLRDLGLVHYQQDAYYAAAHYLEAYLEREPDSPEAIAIRQNLAEEFARWARMN
ncbi:MAG: transglutaminase-like domain-containing protein [Anaerolineae bacterium]|nr:transglutaminase-like domain-containing protein [Anaerolineae bacterium]